MSEKLEREVVGGNGSTGTKVSDSMLGLDPAIGAQAAVVGRGGFRHLDSTTTSFFFTHIPDHASKSDLRKLFLNFGKVEEVFIPNKLDRWGKRFGFVKFKEVRDEEELEGRLEEVWLWILRLKVNRVRIGREEKEGVEKKEEGKSKQNNRLARDERMSIVNGRSFKAVLVNEEDVGAVGRKELPCLDLLPSEEMLEFLKIGYVAELNQGLQEKEVQQGMVMEGISNVNVTTMGDRLMFLKVEEIGGVDTVKKNHPEWWSAMFKRVRRWSPHMVAASKSAWMKVYGIPLHIWDEPLFKRIGAFFGVFEDFDEDTVARNSFDIGRIRVSTERRAFINERVKIRVVGAEFVLWVVKEGGDRRFSVKEMGWVDDDIMSVGSREADV